jgi:hypothetical protein
MDSSAATLRQINVYALDLTSGVCDHKVLVRSIVFSFGVHAGSFARAMRIYSSHRRIIKAGNQAVSK